MNHHLAMTCRFQADSFYNAAHIVGANDLSIMSKLSSGDISSIRQTMGVSIVLLAFSVELYVKDLHFALTGKAPTGHNIYKLFEGLPLDVQQEILSDPAISIYNAVFKKSEDYLKDISDGFVIWRYSHEVNTAKYEAGFAIAFIEVLKKIADSTRQKQTNP